MQKENYKLQKEDGYYYLMEEGNDIAIATTDQSFIDELGAMKLSKQNCDEIFGVVDVEKLADEYIVIKPKHREHEHNLAVSAYIEGFNKAMELNKDKVFTLEDIGKAIMFGRWEATDKAAYNNFIQSLQQPTEIEVEIVTNPLMSVGLIIADFSKDVPVDIVNMKPEVVEESCELDENGCLILKKK